MNVHYKNFLKYIFIAGLIYMPIFGHLDTLPIRIYDEARLAINSYEMFKNGDYIVTHYNGNPDMWNTKPPLLIWIQVIFMKILGVNELAIRLPSAFAAFLTCIALLFFSIRYLKNFWLGFIAVFVLITSQGYVGIHASRTGDYDAMLTLFTTLSVLLFFTFCETQKNKFLYLFFLFTAMSVLTKSITGMFFLPAIFIYIIVQKQLITLFKNKHFYIGLSFFLFIVVGYYLLRETYNPGYIEAVQKNELGGRYLNTIENHKYDFWFYYKNIIDRNLSYWHIFIPCGLVVGFFIKNKKINRIMLYFFLLLFTYFLVISSAQTKLEWYDVPLYPFLAVIIAIFIYFLFDMLQKNTWANQSLYLNVLPFIFLFLLGITPYKKIIEKTYKPKEFSWDKELFEIGYFLKDAIKGKFDLNNKFLIYDGYNAHNLFYLNILNDNGTTISFKQMDLLSPMDIVIAHQSHVKQYLEVHYKNEIIEKNGIVFTYKILKRNNKP